MINEFIAEAETVKEALEIALKELDASIDEVDYAVVEEPGKKRFGFGSSKNAKVSVARRSESSSADTSADSESAGINSSASSTSLLSGDGKASGDNSESGSSSDGEDAIPAGQTGRNASYTRDEVDYSSLTDEEIDKIADTAITVITKLADLAGATDYEIEEFEGEEGEIILDLVGGDLSFLIGRHGRTLDALQTAASAIVTKKCGIRYPISIDIEGYRHRRKQKVREIAQRAAERALRHGRPVELRPMSPQERRLVHVAIRDIKGVTSTSEGNGDARHVVVLAEKN